MKTLRSFWQYYRDDLNDNITESESFKFKIKILGKTHATGITKDVKIAVVLKYLSNFVKTLEILLFNCEINLILTWSKDCVISSATRATKFKITDTKLYVPVVTLSTEDNAKLLQQSKSDVKRTINWNKYQPKVSTERQNQYLYFLIDPSFQGVNRLYVLSLENEEGREANTGYYPSKVEIKDYNVMIIGKNFFDQPVKSDMRTCDNLPKIAAGQGDDYTTSCLLGYNYFNKDYKMIAIDLSKQHELDADPEAVQQINFTGNLERDKGAMMFLNIEEAKIIRKELLKYCNFILF